MELQKSNGHIWKGVAAGLIGGLVATWAMGHFQGAWSDASEIARPSNRESHNGSEEKEDDPTMKTAEAISESVFGHSLAKKKKEKAGPLVHYAFGTLMGGVYGLAAEISPTVKSVGGTAVQISGKRHVLDRLSH